MLTLRLALGADHDFDSYMEDLVGEPRTSVPRGESMALPHGYGLAD